MPIEFAADAIGTAAMCPFCRKTTELTLGAPPQEPAIPRRLIIWSVIVLVIVALGAVGITVAFKRAQDLAKDRQPVSAAPARK